MKTLAEYNTRDFRPREWSGYTLITSAVIVGWQKTHFGFAETVTAIPDTGAKYRIGSIHSVHPVCNGNGQKIGNGIRKGLDTADVTCIKCRRWLGEAI